MKYTFINEEVPLTGSSAFSHQKVTFEFQADTLQEVLQNFQQFLQGVGFVFDGQLDVVNDEERCGDDELDVELYNSKGVMDMPGTIGGAKVVFTDTIPPISDIDRRCKVCGLTRHQLGDHCCYDTKCGLK